MPTLAAGQHTSDLRVVVVTPDERDGRFIALHEALEFWNRTLSELNVPTRLIEAQVLAAPPMTRTLENYTRQVWLLAGRSVSKEGGPKPPRELSELKGDIVVFLSKQVIFSFARPFGEATRFFVGIQTDTAPPLTYPNVSRNVIAHELGHTLGLEHNGDTPTLMCGPCRHLLYQSEEPVFFPLTPEERARLRALHQSQPRSRQFSEDFFLVAIVSGMQLPDERVRSRREQSLLPVVGAKRPKLEKIADLRSKLRRTRPTLAER